MQATIVTVVLEDGSEVYDLLLTQGDDQIQISMGSLEGCEQVISCINNHATGALRVNEVTRTLI